jgi:hypothetical protein
VTSKVVVQIGRGENHDRMLTYHNVVRGWIKLGDWNGNAATYSVALSDIPKGGYSLKDIDRLDVVVQSGAAKKPGLMLGAASIGCCASPSN